MKSKTEKKPNSKVPEQFGPLVNQHKRMAMGQPIMGTKKGK